MRRFSEKLQHIVESVVSAMGYELVGIEQVQRPRNSLLRVYIDHENGITLDDCQGVSHQLSGVLDVEDPIQGNYTLEISSPGLDRPIFKASDFERFTGHKVKIKLSSAKSGRRNYSGTLQGLKDEEVVLQDGDDEIRLPLSKIEQARLVPEF
jgi:ribosome maturation factor RimP